MQLKSSQTWITGIDVSTYQGNIDWAKINTDPKGIKWAYLRVYGSIHTTIDSKFVQYAKDSKAAGFPTGGYYYAMPMLKDGQPDYAGARTQAQQFIDGLQAGYGTGKYGDLLPMLDLEDSSGQGSDVLKMSIDQMNGWAYEFKRYFEEKTGVRLGLYSGQYFIKDQRGNFNGSPTAPYRGNILRDMPLWVAGYEDEYPAVYGEQVPDSGGWVRWTIHQYSQKGSVLGIPDNSVDLNRAASVDDFRISKVGGLGTKGLITEAKMKENLLSMTGLYETSTAAPASYGITAGNFDGQGLSHGVLQFNFGSGTLQPIWKDLLNNSPTVVQGAITNTADYDYFRDLLLNKTKDDQVAFGNTITDPNNKNKIIEPWNTYFKNLGQTQASIDRQVLAADSYYQTAKKWFNDFGLWSRRGLALLFDIAVQSGGIAQAQIDQINADFKAIDTTGKSREVLEVEKMTIIANRRADVVSTEWRESYRARKLGIAYGNGWVYNNSLFMDTIKYDMVLQPAYSYNIPPTDGLNRVTFAGKVKGDADNSRQIFYIGTSTTEVAPSAIPTEVTSYDKISVENDGQSLLYSITTGTNAHIQFQYGFIVSSSNLTELEFRLKGTANQPFTLSVWNVKTNAWEQSNKVTFNSSTAGFVSIKLTGNFDSYIDPNTSKVKYSMYSVNGWSSGTLSLSSDYAELLKTYGTTTVAPTEPPVNTEPELPPVAPAPSETPAPTPYTPTTGAVGTASVTITDLFDPIVSELQPYQPKVGTLWIDTSVVPNPLRRWDGTSWVKVTPLTASDVNTYSRDEVNGLINSKLSGTATQENIANLEKRVTTNESNITQATNSIGLSVKKTEMDVLNNAVKKVRYIRDWINGSNVNTSNVWTEIKAIAGDVNRAKGLTATSNQTISGALAMTDEITNDTASYLIGTAGTLQYVQLDLGAIYEDIDYIHVYHYAGRSFNGTKTEISADGTNWTTLYDSAVGGVYKEDANGKVFPVNSSAMNGLIKRLQSAEASIKVNADSIEQVVSETGMDGQTIISKVNQTASTYKIEAKNIQLQGAVTVLSDISGKLGTITAGDISGATIRGAKFLGASGGGDSMLIGNNGSRIDSAMAGSILRFRFNVDDDTYLAIDGGDVFNFVMGGSFNTKIYKSGDHTMFKLGNAIIKGLGTADTVQVRTYDDSGYGDIAAKDITATNTLNAWNGVEVSGNGGDMLRLAGSTHAFIEWYPQGKAAGRKGWMGYGAASDPNFSIDSGSGEIILKTDSNRVKIDNGVVGVHFKNAADTAYVPVNASAFTVGSRRAWKKNINPVSDSMLDKVLSTQVYNYQLEEEVEGELPHIGLIYEESPVEIVDVRGQGIDLYAMNAMLFRAVQELADKVYALEGKQPVKPPVVKPPTIEDTYVPEVVYAEESDIETIFVKPEDILEGETDGGETT